MSASAAARGGADHERQRARRRRRRATISVEPVLDDRDLAATQPGDPILVDVGAHDVVAEVGEAAAVVSPT